MQNIANLRLRRIEQESQHLEQTLAPAAARKRNDALEADRIADNTRLERQLTNAEREKVLTHKRQIIDATDFSLGDSATVRETMDAQNDTGVPFTEFEYRKGEQKAKRDVEKSFDEFTKNADRFALGTYDTWDQAKAAFGHKLSAQQDAIGKARWEAAYTYVEKLARNEESKAAKDELQMKRLHQLIRGATAEKPVPIGRGDLALMPADELLQTDPRVVKNYDRLLEAKEGLLRKQVKDATRKRDESRLKAKGINDTPELRRQYDWRVDLAGFNFDMRAGDEDAKAAQAELQAIQAKRAERRGTPIVAAPGAPPPVQVAPKPSGGGLPPKKGDKKEFTSGPFAGKVGEWDGSAYFVPD